MIEIIKTLEDSIKELKIKATIPSKLPSLNKINIREFREMHKLSIMDVARATGLSESTIHSVENGKASLPSYETIRRIINFICFGVKFDWDKME